MCSIGIIQGTNVSNTNWLWHERGGIGQVVWNSISVFILHSVDVDKQQGKAIWFFLDIGELSRLLSKSGILL